MAHDRGPGRVEAPRAAEHDARGRCPPLGRDRRLAGPGTGPARRRAPGLARGPADGARAAPGARGGVWRVEAWIGRGGSGDVYRVQRDDGHYAQAAALKWLRRPDDEAERRRFEAERRLLARLEHPAIARLIDGGAHAGRLYAVMEFVDGEPFDRRVAGAWRCSSRWWPRWPTPMRGRSCTAT
ncbi:protein kinase domain-containing protein [Piscinibacter sakaiensis]|uniref:protein kinase domain-containing protein n=1 Tax=Piscinibacter sakaiensis TaxID=1547922 RepID=UPI00372D1210